MKQNIETENWEWGLDYIHWKGYQNNTQVNKKEERRRERKEREYTFDISFEVEFRTCGTQIDIFGRLVNHTTRIEQTHRLL